MKPQDIVFIIATVLLIATRKPRMLVFAGLAGLTLSIPLFARWIFFTAERLTWYAAAWFLLATCVYLYQLMRKGKQAL